MFDSNAWLNEDCDGKPRHEHLCFLVVANGGFNVRGWGFLSYGGGHQLGLNQEDALDLMQFTAFMNGLDAAGVDVFAAFRPYYDAYVAALRQDVPVAKEG